MVVLVWSNIPLISSKSSPDIVSRDCDRADKHAWHFYIEGETPFYCPGPYKCFGERYSMCQDGTDIAKVLPCKHKESGGYQCERLDPHTDGHFFGRHTVVHSIAGNGHECEYIEKTLRKFDEGLDKP